MPEHPEAPVLLFRAGRALQAQGRATEAVPLLERALDGDPGRAEVRFALGQCFFDLGRHAEAVPHLRAAFDAGVRRDLAGIDLARALAAVGRPDDAAPVLEELVLLDLDLESQRALARFAVELGSEELALRVLDRAVAQAPEDGAAHEQRGLVLARMERTGEARSAFGEALRLDPRRASVHLNLAALNAQEGRLDLARAGAARALELRPDYPQARALLQQLR